MAGSFPEFRCYLNLKTRYDKSVESIESLKYLVDGVQHCCTPPTKRHESEYEMNTGLQEPFQQCFDLVLPRGFTPILPYGE